jgi:hypothetical protein
VKNSQKFYTYAYLREDRTPYYIGKGKERRIYSTNRRFKPPKDKTRIIFLKQNLTEEEAFKHEKYMIAVLGRKDLGTGILHNRTDGGEGASGAVKSNETKEKISKANKGKINKPHLEETKRKISESLKGKNNPNYNKPLSDETKRKMKETIKRNQNKKIKRKQRDEIKGRKWWNNGIKTKMSYECPGDGWVQGRPGPLLRLSGETPN